MTVALPSDGPVVELTVRTRKPWKWLLTDRETGEDWEQRDGSWKRPVDPGGARVQVARDVLESLPSLVTEVRISRGLSITDAAEQAGVPVSVLWNIERGLRKPSYNTIIRLLCWVGGEVPE